MEEYVDMLNEVTGEVTGETISKKEAHKKGIWHGAIHVWIISTDRKKILLQKRCSQKRLFPNMWDISVGGHITTGEEPLNSVKRELKEELGLSFNDYEYIYVDTIKEMFKYDDIFSNEFVYIYKVFSDVSIDSITLQKEEVSDIAWFNKKEFNNLINSKKIVNHNTEYGMINNILEG